MIINVMDENDNEPQFEHDVYNVTLLENVPLDSHVLTVLASSKDVGVNAEIMYEIIDGNEHGKFAIDTDAGEKYLFCFTYFFVYWLVYF